MANIGRNASLVVAELCFKLGLMSLRISANNWQGKNATRRLIEKGIRLSKHSIELTHKLLYASRQAKQLLSDLQEIELKLNVLGW